MNAHNSSQLAALNACVADADITTAIETLLATKKGLSAHEITVQTREGIVELAGVTDSLLSQQRAKEIALAERIRARYCWSASLHDQEVDVQVENGRATLSGTVDTWLDRKHAAQEAHEAGAREVNNHLRVLTTALINNEQLAAAVAHGGLV